MDFIHNPMAIRKKLKRKYLVYLDKSIAALLVSIDRINNVHDSYKVEESLILLTSAWELLAKGTLIRDRENIYLADGRSITAENAITILFQINPSAGGSEFEPLSWSKVPEIVPAPLI